MQDVPVNPQKPHFFHLKSATPHTRLKILPIINTVKDQPNNRIAICQLSIKLVKYTRTTPEVIIMTTRYAVKHPWRFFSLVLSPVDITPPRYSPEPEWRGRITSAFFTV